MLDREPEELQHLGVFGILGESRKVGRACARLLGLIAASLVLPLSLALLGHSLLTEPLLNKIRRNQSALEHHAGDAPARERALDAEWARLLTYEATYIVFLFVFSLLSTAAVVYTVACVYTGKRVNLRQVLSVVPRVWLRLMVTFLWYFLINFMYNIALVVAFVILFLVAAGGGSPRPLRDSVGFVIGAGILLLVFFAAHVYISAVWHLASVISVLEESYGLGAIRKAMNLIRGKTLVAFVLVLKYYFANWIVQVLFMRFVVHGYQTASRVRWAVVLVAAMVNLNLVWLLVQSIAYYVCKSYHHENIDKSALSDHLEEYLGEYVPLKSSIQMETLDP